MSEGHENIEPWHGDSSFFKISQIQVRHSTEKSLCVSVTQIKLFHSFNCRLQRCSTGLAAGSRGARRSWLLPLHLSPKTSCAVPGYLRPPQGNPGGLGDAAGASSGSLHCGQTLQVQHTFKMKIFLHQAKQPLWVFMFRISQKRIQYAQGKRTKHM